MSGEVHKGSTGYNFLGDRRALGCTSAYESWRPTAGPLSDEEAYIFLLTVKWDNPKLRTLYPRIPFRNERGDIEGTLDSLMNFYRGPDAAKFGKHVLFGIDNHQLETKRMKVIQYVDGAMEHDEIGNLFAVPDDNPELQRHRDVFVNWLQDVLASPK